MVPVRQARHLRKEHSYQAHDLAASVSVLTGKCPVAWLYHEQIYLANDYEGVDARA